MNTNCPYLEMQCENLICDCPKYKAYIKIQDPKEVERVLKEHNFDISLPTWQLLMQMQKAFANQIRPLDKPTKEDVDKWVDKYLVCILDEVREIREHLIIYSQNTKTTTIDIELQKEVIDVLHFIMDLYIMGGATDKDIEKFYVKHYNLDILQNNDLIETAFMSQQKTINTYLYTQEDINYDISILKASCKLEDACALVRQHISWKHWKKPADYIDYDKLYNSFAILFHEFINLCILTMEM